MAHRLARTLLFLFLLACTPGPLPWAPAPQQHAGGYLQAAPAEARSERIVYLGGHFSPDELIGYTCNLAAGGPQALVLLDSPVGSANARELLAAYRPDRIVPVGGFPGGVDEVAHRLKVKLSEHVSWNGQPSAAFWKSLFPRAPQVVVCPSEPRRLLLQSACLAVSLHAPLFVLNEGESSLTELQALLHDWHTEQVFAVGRTGPLCEGLKHVRISKLQNEDSVFQMCVEVLHKNGPIASLVVANPDDIHEECGGTSSLAPWLAGQRRALLLLTAEHGNNVEELVQTALRDPRLHEVENVLLAGGLEAIPVKRRPNPIPEGKDPFIEMEPLTPEGDAPYTFSVGRLFSDSPALVTLQLGRQRLVQESQGPRKALVASNPGGSLPLLETFSRTTALEIRNAGYQTTTLFGKELNKDLLRRSMPQHDILLWEGHHNTLVKEWGMPDWDETLPGTFVFLQSCLALQEAKAQPLIHRGAIGIVGSSTRTFSASGGAMSLAFFDALMYDQQTVGGALRQAKNFLLAYSLLKEKRLGLGAHRLGANQRAAWSFSLWGDPTLSLPAPEQPEGRRPPVRHEVQGDTIVLRVPDKQLDRVTTSKYQVQMPANARLAGLIHRDTEGEHPLIPFVFAEVHFPKAPDGKVPHLRSKLSSFHYVFNWDERRRTGYLLVEPHSVKGQELRFQVTWDTAETQNEASSAGQ